MDVKKLCGYSHNGYPIYMSTGTGTRQIFIQRVGYGGATNRTLAAPLTSLGHKVNIGQEVETLIMIVASRDFGFWSFIEHCDKSYKEYKIKSVYLSRMC